MTSTSNSLFRFINRPALRQEVIERVRDKTRHRKLIGMNPNLWKITESFNQYLELQSSLWRMLETRQQIVIGPWLSEVGFEVLYWIPFVRWFKDYYQVPSYKLTILSRGGCRDWYQGIGDRYVELLDLFSPEEFHDRTMKRWQENDQGQKQYQWSSFEEEVKTRLTGQVPAFKNLKPHDLGFAHPGFMYNLFKHYWKARLPVGAISSRTQVVPLQCQETYPLELPESYTAAKFYFSACFPKTEANQAFTYSVLKRLASQGPVVLLESTTQLDDHAEMTEIPSSPNMIRLNSIVTPQNNLGVQTYSLSRAKRWVGTYGGFSYLGPFYGVSSLAYFSERDQFLTCHLDWMAQAMRTLRKFPERRSVDFITKSVDLPEMG